MSVGDVTSHCVGFVWDEEKAQKNPDKPDWKRDRIPHSNKSDSFGLMRGREFIMKDGYSFHTDEESLKKTYQDRYQAYNNMMRRSGLKFRPVEADSGAIGGSGSTEFMILADAGEDEVLYTEDGQYSANVEKAVSLPPDAEPSPFTTYEKRDTPNTPTIESVCKLLKCSPTQVVKNVLNQTYRHI